MAMNEFYCNTNTSCESVRNIGKCLYFPIALYLMSSPNLTIFHFKFLKRCGLFFVAPKSKLGEDFILLLWCLICFIFCTTTSTTNRTGKHEGWDVDEETYSFSVASPLLLLVEGMVWLLSLVNW